jgi:hypothetical protein
MKLVPARDHQGAHGYKCPVGEGHVAEALVLVTSVPVTEDEKHNAYYRRDPPPDLDTAGFLDRLAAMRPV